MMIRTLAFVGMMLVAQGIWAQNTPVKLEWPRSFTGQPDFAFTRDEAFAEARARAARENATPPAFPTLLMVATDENEPDPLRLKVQVVSTTVNAQGDVVSTTVAPVGMSLLDKMIGNMSGLPTYATPTAVNAGEYRASMAQVISATIAAWQPDVNRYDYSSVLGAMTLQAVVTSPEAYAVINGTRYTVGNSFLLKVPVMVPDADIMAALDAAAPTPVGMDEATATAYGQVREEVLAAFAAARNKTPAIGQQVLHVPVVVERIEPRRVVLQVNGQPQVLAIRYAY